MFPKLSMSFVRHLLISCSYSESWYEATERRCPHLFLVGREGHSTLQGFSMSPGNSGYTELASKLAHLSGGHQSQAGDSHITQEELRS